MPHVFLTRNYLKVNAAKKAGFTTCSLQGSSRSAKTWSVIQWLCIYCNENAGMTVSVIRAGMPSIKRTVYRDFKNIMISFGWWEDKRMNKSEFVYTFPNGSWLEFFSTDNEQKVRGSKRKILFVNEANELNFLEWQQLQMRTTEFSILDYNPSFSEEHWINQVNEEKGTYWFISTYKDNPFLEQRVVDEIESLRTKNNSLWQIYGLGLRAIIEGRIFESINIIEDVPRHVRKHHFRGMDFGFSHDPTAIEDVYIETQPSEVTIRKCAVLDAVAPSCAQKNKRETTLSGHYPQCLFQSAQMRRWVLISRRSDSHASGRWPSAPCRPWQDIEPQCPLSRRPHRSAP